MSIGYNPEGHLIAGEMRCNKCGAKLIEEGGYYDCCICGPICKRCSYECFVLNIHCRIR